MPWRLNVLIFFCCDHAVSQEYSHKKMWKVGSLVCFFHMQRSWDSARAHSGATGPLSFQGKFTCVGLSQAVDAKWIPQGVRFMGGPPSFLGIFIVNWKRDGGGGAGLFGAGFIQEQGDWTPIPVQEGGGGG